MNWELILSVVSLIFGGGCLGWVFYLGYWKGEITQKIDDQGKSLIDFKSQLIELSKQKPNETGVYQTVTETTQELAEKIRGEMNLLVNRIHQRIDEINSTERTRKSAVEEQQQKLSIVIAGIQSQRTEWDILRTDVRKLLASEATTAVEITNIKERVNALESKRNELAEKVAAIQAEINSLLRGK